MFKAGDRVIFTGPSKPAGFEGTVIVPGLSGATVGVDFDGFTNGHDLNGLLNNSSSGWWCVPAWLMAVPEREPDPIIEWWRSP